MSVRSRLALDAALFATLLAAFYPSLTGISVHEWLSLGIVLPGLFHLIVNWDWVMRIAARIAGKLKVASRVNFVVDAMLFISAVAVMVSGLMVSQAIAAALGVVIVPTTAWHVVHSVSADATIALTVLHLALHARWIASALSSRTAPALATEEARCAS